NPEAATTLRRAIDAINASPIDPAFLVLTGDVSHTTDDPAERRRRLRAVRADVKVKDVRVLPGEHDASLDRGEAFREVFGASRFSFARAGVRFVGVDNVSDP